MGRVNVRTFPEMYNRIHTEITFINPKSAYHKMHVFVVHYCPVLLTWHSCIISRLVHKVFFYLPSTFGIYRKFYRNFAITYADNETFCTVLLTSQVVMIQSLQPKGREFESTCVCVWFFLPLFDSFIFIYYRCTTTSEEWNFGSFYFKRLMRNA